ncbi:hypothetical protein CVO74_17035 [Xanthomonas prunicola]|uniref:Uncharacterized protein n=1 Tax=Xanthomonas prunicola TaxID=2053930 RepID=A0A2N3RDV4_9XANT|nr:hypothetical protein XpruCFBP8353_22135 [Xanthomonas prunicola]PKV14909.1 hypothetical protein XpruCFBP8354_22390 [Xanthomonas prunicola]PKV19841.1 hypothetical protein CVO74_17035 [Xanthomonas prunicola]
MKATCGPVFSAFTPEAGKDYEVESPRKKHLCKAVVSQLDASGEKSTAPVDVTAVGMCSQGSLKLVPVPVGEE